MLLASIAVLTGKFNAVNANITEIKSSVGAHSAKLDNLAAEAKRDRAETIQIVKEVDNRVDGLVAALDDKIQGTVREAVEDKISEGTSSGRLSTSKDQQYLLVDFIISLQNVHH